MKSTLLVFITFILLLVGCTQHQEIKTTQTNQKKTEPFSINGDITIKRKIVFIKGQSNLKPGTKLLVRVHDKKMGEMTVQKNGDFHLTFDRPELKIGDEILVLLNPELQSDKLKSIYGELGQRFKGDYLYHYTKQGKGYAGLEAGILIYSDLDKASVNQIVISSRKILELHRKHLQEKK